MIFVGKETEWVIEMRRLGLMKTGKFEGMYLDDFAPLIPVTNLLL